MVTYYTWETAVEAELWDFLQGRVNGELKKRGVNMGCMLPPMPGLKIYMDHSGELTHPLFIYRYEDSNKILTFHREKKRHPKTDRLGYFSLNKGDQCVTTLPNSFQVSEFMFARYDSYLDARARKEGE